MNIYNAIMKAADHIAANPADFNFMSTDVPSCGTPGCALGWIGHFLDMNLRGPIAVATDGLKIPPQKRSSHAVPGSDLEFYNRMDLLCGEFVWKDDAAVCAAGLRKYAAKYHGHEKTRQEVVPWSAVAWRPREIA